MATKFKGRIRTWETDENREETDSSPNTDVTSISSSSKRGSKKKSQQPSSLEDIHDGTQFAVHDIPEIILDPFPNYNPQLPTHVWSNVVGSDDTRSHWYGHAKGYQSHLELTSDGHMSFRVPHGWLETKTPTVDMWMGGYRESYRERNWREGVYYDLKSTHASWWVHTSGERGFIRMDASSGLHLETKTGKFQLELGINPTLRSTNFFQLLSDPTLQKPSLDKHLLQITQRNNIQTDWRWQGTLSLQGGYHVTTQDAPIVIQGAIGRLQSSGVIPSIVLEGCGDILLNTLQPGQMVRMMTDGFRSQVNHWSVSSDIDVFWQTGYWKQVVVKSQIVIGTPDMMVRSEITNQMKTHGVIDWTNDGGLWKMRNIRGGFHQKTDDIFAGYLWELGDANELRWNSRLLYWQTQVPVTIQTSRSMQLVSDSGEEDGLLLHNQNPEGVISFRGYHIQNDISMENGGWETVFRSPKTNWTVTHPDWDWIIRGGKHRDVWSFMSRRPGRVYWRVHGDVVYDVASSWLLHGTGSSSTMRVDNMKEMSVDVTDHVYLHGKKITLDSECLDWKIREGFRWKTDSHWSVVSKRGLLFGVGESVFRDVREGETYFQSNTVDMMLNERFHVDVSLFELDVDRLRWDIGEQGTFRWGVDNNNLEMNIVGDIHVSSTGVLSEFIGEGAITRWESGGYERKMMVEQSFGVVVSDRYWKPGKVMTVVDRGDWKLHVGGVLSWMGDMVDLMQNGVDGKMTVNVDGMTQMRFGRDVLATIHGDMLENVNGRVIRQVGYEKRMIGDWVEEVDGRRWVIESGQGDISYLFGVGGKSYDIGSGVSWNLVGEGKRWRITTDDNTYEERTSQYVHSAVYENMVWGVVNHGKMELTKTEWNIANVNQVHLDAKDSFTLRVNSGPIHITGNQLHEDYDGYRRTYTGSEYHEDCHADRVEYVWKGKNWSQRWDSHTGECLWGVEVRETGDMIWMGYREQNMIWSVQRQLWEANQVQWNIGEWNGIVDKMKWDIVDYELYHDTSVHRVAWGKEEVYHHGFWKERRDMVKNQWVCNVGAYSTTWSEVDGWNQIIPENGTSCTTVVSGSLLWVSLDEQSVYPCRRMGNNNGGVWGVSGTNICYRIDSNSICSVLSNWNETDWKKFQENQAMGDEFIIEKEGNVRYDTDTKSRWWMPLDTYWKMSTGGVWRYDGSIDWQFGEGSFLCEQERGISFRYGNQVSLQLDTNGMVDIQGIICRIHVQDDINVQWNGLCDMVGKKYCLMIDEYVGNVESCIWNVAKNRVDYVGGDYEVRIGGSIINRYSSDVSSTYGGTYHVDVKGHSFYHTSGSIEVNTDVNVTMKAMKNVDIHAEQYMLYVGEQTWKLSSNGLDGSVGAFRMKVDGDSRMFVTGLCEMEVGRFVLQSGRKALQWGEDGILEFYQNGSSVGGIYLDEHDVMRVMGDMAVSRLRLDGGITIDANGIESSSILRLRGDTLELCGRYRSELGDGYLLDVTGVRGYRNELRSWDIRSPTVLMQNTLYMGDYERGFIGSWYSDGEMCVQRNDITWDSVQDIVSTCTEREWVNVQEGSRKKGLYSVQRVGLNIGRMSYRRVHTEDNSYVVEGREKVHIWDDIYQRWCDWHGISQGVYASQVLTVPNHLTNPSHWKTIASLVDGDMDVMGNVNIQGTVRANHIRTSIPSHSAEKQPIAEGTITELFEKVNVVYQGQEGWKREESGLSRNETYTFETTENTPVDMDLQSLVAVLWKEVQSLRQEIKNIRSKSES